MKMGRESGKRAECRISGLKKAVLMMGLVVCTGCKKAAGNLEDIKPASQAGEEAECLKIVLACPGDMQDSQMVQMRVSVLMKEKAGVEIELKKYPMSEYATEISRMLSGHEQVDLFFMNRTLFWESYMQNRLLELSSLIGEKGQGILEQVGGEYVEACRIQGKLYSVPVNRDCAIGWDSYAFSTELLKRYGISADEIGSYDDLEKAFEKVHESEPGLTVIRSGTGSMGYNQHFLSSAPFGGIIDSEKDNCFINVFESDEYMGFLERIRRWYQKGYISENVLTDQKKIAQQLRNGDLFCYVTLSKPGIEGQETRLMGTDITVLQLGDTALVSNQCAEVTWGAAADTASPEKAMEVLNLLYTDKEIMTLLAYGIEGVHYEMTPDGFLTETKNGEPYSCAGYTWVLPNSFLLDVWEGTDPDIWEDTRVANKSAARTCDYGFNFDPSSVYGECMKVQEVYRNYQTVVENGMADPEEACAALNRELEDCGLDRIIEEKNRQFLAWKENQEN